MLKFEKNTVPSNLDNWGVVSDLGATLLEGEAVISGKFIVGNPETPISCAFFACTKSKFKMVYDFNEHAVLMEGTVILTNEKTGETNTYEAGDAWYVEKGTPVLWEITSPRIVKNYCAIA